MKKDIEKVSSLKAARIGIFSALYIATSLIPISVFIGAPSFLALNLIVTPVIAILLPPFEAFFTALFGGFLALYVAPSQAMFGFFTSIRSFRNHWETNELRPRKS